MLLNGGVRVRMPESLQKILADAKGGKFSSITGLSEDGKCIRCPVCLNYWRH